MNTKLFLTAITLCVLAAACGCMSRAADAALPEETESVVEEEEWRRPLGVAKFRRAGIRVNEEFNYASELLMLARAIYSESKVTGEQYVIAWVTRIRVETGYRRERSYRAVALDPIQYSAFNNPRRRNEYLALDFDTPNAKWQDALGVARSVIRDEWADNPLPENCRHFFSPQSMRGGEWPAWASDGRVFPLTEVNSQRLVVVCGVS